MSGQRYSRDFKVEAVKFVARKGKQIVRNSKAMHVWFLGAMWMFVVPYAAAGQEVTLIDEGEAVARIYHTPLGVEALPRTTESDASARSPQELGPFRREFDTLGQGQLLLATAIDDINYHFEKMTGAALEVIETDDPGDIEGPAIVIGVLAERLGAEQTEHADEPEAFRLLTSDGNVLIAGHGEYADFGSTHGIYELLYRLGFDWLFPGEEGEIIPDQNTVSVPELDVQSAPSFNQRHTWYGGMQRDAEAQYEFFRWQQRMRTHPHHRDVLIETLRTGGHGSTHRLHRFHDELDDCVEPADTQVVQESIEEIRERFEENGWPSDKKVSIRGYGPGDGGSLQRPFTDRMAIDSGRPDGTDLIILFFNTILEELEDEFPNMHMSYLVYSWHSDYPKRYRPHPRIAVEVADLNFSRLHAISDLISGQRNYFRGIQEAWGRLHEEQGNVLHRWYYGYNVANGYLPISMLTIYGDGIPFERELGFTGVNFNLYDNWEVSGASTYVGMRLAWDHTQDWREILREFCEKAYGPAADAMEQYFLAMDDRQRSAGVETGSFFGYPFIYDYEFLTEMEDLLSQAYNQADTDLQRTRISYMQIQPERLRMFLDMHEHRTNFEFEQALEVYERMQERHAEDMERNRQFASRMGSTFLRLFYANALTGAVEYSSDPYRIVYQIPDRLKTSFDRKVMGQLQGYYRREINDDHHLVSSTYGSTWDAQGFQGYRKGAVWYRIPFELDLSQLERDEDGNPTLGLLIGGGEGMVRVYLNDRFVAQGRASLARPTVFDLTDYIEDGDDNLLALQFDRIGNDELGTGGMTQPSFLFTGPRVDMEDQEQNRPFRILPGGIYQYVD